MECPKCRNEEMVTEKYGTIDVNRCPTCRGLYLERGKLTLVLRSQLGNEVDSLNFSASSDQMDQVDAKCWPCGGRPMQSVHGPSGIRVDRCDQCEGLFLDQGELATIQLHARDHKND